MLLEYNAVKSMNQMVTVLPISKFGIVSSYVIKYALLIAGIESNPGPQLNNKKNIKIIHSLTTCHNYSRQLKKVVNQNQELYLQTHRITPI
jgi:hypothetical protein